MPLLSADEKRVLELYERLQQLQLEIALLNAQNNYLPNTNSGATIEDAQKALLDSRSRYVLRNEVVGSVMSANPILQAVHQGTKASPIEKDLLPLLQTRDTASSSLASQSGTLHSLRSSTLSTAAETQRRTRTNVALAAELLDLAARSAAPRAEAEKDPKMAALETEVRDARRRWRVLKATAAAVVAGSGVDWSRDEEMRSVVLDAEGEEEV
ncbi:centromere protein H (CENP-H)-domain-containing protein [Xylariomycetidae sp. FL0641]|nr:centromere protein H (CENP-H)-domain-containing protein [Xylariomycetidae sp. FL0641]